MDFPTNLPPPILPNDVIFGVANDDSDFAAKVNAIIWVDANTWNLDVLKLDLSDIFEDLELNGIWEIEGHMEADEPFQSLLLQ